MLKIVLYGFGNISHAIVSNLKNKNFKLTVLSSTAQCSRIIEITNVKNQAKGKALLEIDPKKCLPDADYLIFCVPSNIRKEAINKIKNHINSKTILGALPGVSGFNEEIKEILPSSKAYFSVQRVPFIARVIDKGRLVRSEKKENLYLAVTKSVQDKVINDMGNFFEQKIEVLPSFDLVNLTNSNPLLHTSRIYDFLNRSKEPYEIDENEMFYENWSDAASFLLVKMDEEFQEIMRAKGHNSCSILEHYGVTNTYELTRKLRSISAFQGIKFPMRKSNGLNVIDFSSRYFTEDFALGLNYTIDKAIEMGITAHYMNTVHSMFMNVKK